MVLSDDHETQIDEEAGPSLVIAPTDEEHLNIERRNSDRSRNQYNTVQVRQNLNRNSESPSNVTSSVGLKKLLEAKESSFAYVED